jgi:hypothetical protein
MIPGQGDTGPIQEVRLIKNLVSRNEKPGTKATPRKDSYDSRINSCLTNPSRCNFFKAMNLPFKH